LIPGKQTFDKLWLEPQIGTRQIDLRSWINRFYPHGCSDLLLQMDIEGAEYRNILATDLETLKLFRIIILEVHGLSQLNSASVLHSVFYQFFSKIGNIFTCVHAHPNNYSGTIVIRGKQINLSDVLELTFLRTDVLAACPPRDFRSVLVPHPLDITNSMHTPPIVLDEFWCGGARPIESRIKIIEDKLAYETLKNVQLTNRVEVVTNRVDVDLNKAIAGAFKLALSGSVLKCMSIPDSESEAKDILAPLIEVAVGRRFYLSSLHTAAPLRIAANHPFFFHTQLGWDESITIDLEETRVLNALVVVNRIDTCFDRASVLYLSLSADSNFEDNGERFYLNVPEEFTRGRNLHMLVPIPSTPTRFLRVSSPLFTALHFSELRAYAVRVPAVS
jgi:hypothetical protein